MLVSTRRAASEPSAPARTGPNGSIPIPGLVSDAVRFPRANHGNVSYSRCRVGPANRAVVEKFVELSSLQSIFIGFKLDGGLRRQLESLTGPDRRYVSPDDSTFLMTCKKGSNVYVGKLIQDGLTTDRVDDVKRNVLSIMRRLCPDVRLPNVLEIWAVEPRVESADASVDEGPPPNESASDGW